MQTGPFCPLCGIWSIAGCCRLPLIDSHRRHVLLLIHLEATADVSKTRRNQCIVAWLAYLLAALSGRCIYRQRELSRASASGEFPLLFNASPSNVPKGFFAACRMVFILGTQDRRAYHESHSFTSFSFQPCQSSRSPEDPKTRCATLHKRHIVIAWVGGASASGSPAPTRFTVKWSKYTTQTSIIS